MAKISRQHEPTTCVPLAHKKRSGKRGTSFLFSCPRCDKHTYPDRKSARRAARVFHPDDHLAAYRCPHAAGWWHIGHTSPQIRDEFRGRSA